MFESYSKPTLNHSRLRITSRNRARQGFVLPTAAALMVCCVPLCGLAVDVGTFYMIQSKLQAAADAGALSGARSLARGSNSAAQITNAQTTATNFLNANFPSGYLNSSNLTIPTPTVTLDATNAQRSVAVNPTVRAPHMFFLWFSNVAGTYTTVGATSTATRRDVNVMMVMDRSGSLAASSSCTPLKNAAVNFVNKFAEGRDYVGLTTFATSYQVDVALSQTFKTNVTTGINAITCSGSTSSAAGLWTGYRALASLAQPAALNVILFFTDGDPTSVTADFAIKAASSCTVKTNRTGVATTAGSEIRGIMTGTPQSPIASNDAVAASNSSGCAYNASWQSNRYLVGNDVTGIPSTDAFGNSLTFSYLSVTTASGMLAAASNSTNSANFLNASYNAAASAADRIRSAASPGNGAAALNNVVIYSIGLGGSGSASDDFLQYVANDPSNTSHYNSSQMPGIYVYANNSSALASAFDRIASEILRISQ